ncbi:VOC family protein [Pontimicrobium sp. IMCC45349]|uniref:VOC family protein n=1 Tax=Pontimicrobium sp. IMCC45349 TaxID=3391574 RepID=UPI00399FDA4E
MKNLFHLSLPCKNLVDTKMFYVDTIGATLGRYANNWLDVDLFGHQLTFTQAGKFDFINPSYMFEGKILSSFHFGIILDIDSWEKNYTKLINQDLELTKQTTFLKNKVGEHISFFVTDPNGYIVEFKSFKNKEEIF